jgi:sugar lactone lactonase YvrE
MNCRLYVAFAALAGIVLIVALMARPDHGIEAAPGDTVADFVYGQFGSFTTNNLNCASFGTINAGSLCSPNGITIDSSGRLWITDTNNHRVPQYDTPLTSSAANRVIGQLGSFTTGVCNTGGVSADSLCWPAAVAVDSRGNLYVADNSNQRVLEFDDPVNTAPTADRVFGQFGSFTTSVSNNGGTSANSLWHPAGVAVDLSDNLYVADRYNYRVLEYIPTSSGTTADRVFGQLGSMTSGVLNLDGVSAILGSSPQSAASKPMARPGDTDGDGLGAADERLFGSTEGDSDHDTVVNNTDLLGVALHFPTQPLGYHFVCDGNRDGVVNNSDLLVVALQLATNPTRCVLP